MGTTETGTALPIIGIGASAGGLAALEAFFAAVAASDSAGMCFVVIQHLSPDHASLLPQLLARRTSMVVSEATHGVQLQAGHTYVTPRHHNLAVRDGALQLVEPEEPRGHRLPVDCFFRSLALERAERSIGIVLAGTGRDGADGVRAIDHAGGLVMAQRPDSTAHDGMPRSAIDTGLVDYVLPPNEMPAALVRELSSSPRFSGKEVVSPAEAVELMGSILDLVHARTDHDFSGYKQTTIKRRIERRMGMRKQHSLRQYARCLAQEPDEIDALFRDFLIGVTRFFRDGSSFDALGRAAHTHLIANKPNDASLRAWVPGCSTGEEAYSIAILLAEQLADQTNTSSTQVFATDIDRNAIDVARRGRYPGSAKSNVTEPRIQRFFTQSNDELVIGKSLRDRMIFSLQDVARDPPLSRMDLISCRNVLIYMDAELQRRLVSLLHYALNPGGILFLGSAETIGDHSELFSVVDRDARIYSRLPARSAWRPSSPKRVVTSTATSDPTPQKEHHVMPLRQLVASALLDHLGGAAVLVDEAGDVLYVQGRTGRYLEPAQGDKGMNVLTMAREGLEHELTSALTQSAATGAVVRRMALSVKTNGSCTNASLTVRPVKHNARSLFLIVLEEESPPLALAEAIPTDDPDATLRIKRLVDRLTVAEEHLATSRAAMHETNEQLMASNEELQSTNEELQSTNEELETSKEELHSVNEELATVNTELQDKVSALSRVNNDMSNLLASTDIGTIYVDDDLHILRFTPAVLHVLNLIPSDVGRPLAHVVTNLTGYDRLVADVQETLDSLSPREIEVSTTHGALFLLRMRPYRTAENAVEGAVITFVNIDEVKRVRSILDEAQALNRLAVVVRDASDAITVRDLQGRLVAWNPAAERMYGWSESEALAMAEDLHIPAAERHLGTALGPRATRRLTRDGRELPVWVTTSALVDEHEQVYAVAATESLRVDGDEGGNDS